MQKGPRQQNHNIEVEVVSSFQGNITPERYAENCGMTMTQLKNFKKHARNACTQFRYQQFDEDMLDSVAGMNETRMQQISFVTNVSLQECPEREKMPYYEPLLQVISDDMSLTEHQDVVKMSRNDQDHFFINRVDFLVAELKKTLSSCRPGCERISMKSFVLWRRRKRLFNKTHRAHGCAAPRLAGANCAKQFDVLDYLNFLLPSHFTAAERSAHRVYGIDAARFRFLLKDVYAASHLQTMYLSRVDRTV